MRIIASIIISLFSLTVLGQSNTDLHSKWDKYRYDHVVILTKVMFHVNDTIIPYTLVQEPEGAMHFVEGHQFTEDTVLLDYQVYHSVFKKRTDSLISNVVFHKNSEILTIKDLFSHFSLKNGGILYTYEHDFQFYSYIKELYYSYIFYRLEMDNLAKSVSDSIIRLTNYELKYNNEPRVIIYELKIGSKLIDIKKLSYLVDSKHNFSLDKEDLIPLKKSEIKTLKNTFSYCLKENIQYSFKTNQHNPFLIEYKLMPHYEVIERSDGLDTDMNKHYSVYQSLVSIVNSIGSLSDSKLEKRYRSLKK